MDIPRAHLLGARLSGLLINVGTPCMRRIFDEGVMEKYSPPLKEGVLNLSSFFKNGKIVKVITPYFKGKGKPHLLTKQQWQLLYPVSGEVSSQSFDLTLLTALIQILELVEPPSGDWCSDPVESDCSEAANISRIRLMRNKHYAHVSTTAYTNNRYKTLFKELKDLLLKLGADGIEIDEWNSKFSVQNEQSKNDMHELNEQLINLVRSDLSDIQALQKNLIKIVDTLATKDSVAQQYQILITAVDELKSDIKAESWPNKVLETFAILQETLKDEFKIVSMNFTDLVRSDESIQNILLEIKKQQLKDSKVQLEIKKQLDKLVKEITIDSKIRDNFDVPVPGLLFDDNDWRKIKDPFKILIITSMSQPKSDELSLKEFGKSLGLCPWQIVIDLDYKSQSQDGLFDFINESLKKHTVTQIKTYKTAEFIKEQDIEAVVLGENVLWLLANGSETLECEPCIKLFAKSTSKIEPVFKRIVMKFALKRPILCIAVLLTEDSHELKAVTNIGSMINRIYECQDEKIDITTSKFSVFANKEKFISASIDEIKDETYIEWKRYRDSLTLFSDFFRHCYRRPSDIVYSIPGASESNGLSEEDYVQVNCVMELYHKSIGKLNSEVMSDKEYASKITEIKYRYLKGNPITPETLCLQEDGVQTFVVRKEMKNIKLKVQEELQRRKELSATNKSRKGICLIEHDTSGGGTTCGRYLLFNLRTEFPCIEIKQFGTDLLNWIERIYNITNIPLLLLIDNLDCQTSDILTLERFLENKQVKALIVHLKRKITGRVSSSVSDFDEKYLTLGVLDPKLLMPSTTLDFEKRTIDMVFYLNSQVTETADKFAFETLYDAREKEARTFKLKIFMFGLYKFLGKYDKLDNIIQNCISAAKEPQLKLMRAILYMWKYANSGIKLEVAKKWLLDENEDIEEALGSIADFLVYDSHTQLLKAANDCIIEPFLSNSSLIDNRIQIDLFLEDLTTFAKKESDEKFYSLDMICTLFIKSRKIVGHRWTEFVEDLEMLHSKDFISQGIDKFLTIFDEVAVQCPHLRTFYARYLMHKIYNYEQAILEIRTALDVSESDGICNSSVTDHVLLGAYGYLHRDMMNHKIREYIEKLKKSYEKQPLDDIFHYASEAVEGFARARTCSKTTSRYDKKEMVSGLYFYIEAHTRYMLLNHLFNYCCSGSHESFSNYISDDNCNLLVKESWPRAFRVLQDLEYSIVIGRVEFDTVISQNVTSTKFALLQLLTDKKLSMNDQLSQISDKLPCDVGCFVLNQSSKKSSSREWKDLSDTDLKIIIDKISARIHNPEVMLRANYRDIILAMIYMRQLNAKDNLKFHLKWASECAADWVKNCPKDFEAYFMLGFLRLLKAVSDNDCDALCHAQECLATCQTWCIRNPLMPFYCRFLYNIGTKEGLEKAIPYDKEIDKARLMEFIGKKVDDDWIAVRLGKTGSEFKVKVRKSKTEKILWSVIPKTRLVKFNLAVALDRISAINISKHNNI